MSFKPVILTYPERTVVVRSVDRALEQLANGWPDKATLEFVIAHNACTLAQRGIYEETKARKLFVAAAAAADLIP